MMKVRRSWPIAGVALLIAVVAGAGEGPLVLASGSQARFVIYCGEAEGEVVRHAALELGQWLDAMSGAEFDVTVDAGDPRPKIVVGRHNPLVEGSVDGLGLGEVRDDGFRMVIRDGNLHLAGVLDRGTLYAVYHFLDVVLGVRWFSPEFEVVPSREVVDVGPLDVTENPRFAYREIFSGDTDDAYFRQHNRLNGNRGETHRQDLEYPEEIDTWSMDGPSGGHNFHDIVDPAYHHGGQVLAMEPAVREEAAAHFRARVAADGSAWWYAFSQEDRGWDPDEDSLAFARAHGGALSAPVADMVTDVAGQVRETFPGARLATSAYQWSFAPPEGMRVPAWVMVEIAPIEADLGYRYDDPVRNGAARDAFLGWAAVAGSLGVWDYHANFQNYLQPLPNLDAVFGNIGFLASLGPMRSYFGEGAYNTSGAELAELRAWVAARLLWNPDQDWRALVHEFCEGYYGPAAGPLVEEYLARLRTSFEASGERLASKQRITSPYLGLDFILEADRLLAAADAVAEGPYARHVHEVRLGVDMTILLSEHRYAAEAARRGVRWEHDPERRARFEAYAAEAGVTEYSEDGSLEQLLQAMDIERVDPPAPDLVAPGDRWIDFQDLDMSFCCGAAMVGDGQASDHGALELDNAEWAITLPLDVLPPGTRWRLYGAVRVAVRPDADPGAPAFNMGVEPGGWISPTVSQMADGAYHVFEFPEMPVRYQTGRDVWFSAEPDQVEWIHVDRIVAVAVPPEPRHPAGRTGSRW